MVGGILIVLAQLALFGDMTNGKDTLHGDNNLQAETKGKWWKWTFSRVVADNGYNTSGSAPTCIAASKGFLNLVRLRLWLQTNDCSELVGCGMERCLTFHVYTSLR